MQPVLDSERGGIDMQGDEIRWWTFAGGRINATLRYALEAVRDGWQVVSDNFLVRIRGEDVSEHRLAEARRQIADSKLWDDSHLWANIAGSLPNYRLSKFQPLMPPWVEREMLAMYLLDISGARRTIANPP